MARRCGRSTASTTGGMSVAGRTGGDGLPRGGGVDAAAGGGGHIIQWHSCEEGDTA
jgi:hypothetical protein